jgi:predicted GNAT superfamily acetyltransferase
MTFEFQDVSDSWLAAVLALNESAVPHVNSIDLGQMQWFAEHAAYFRIAVSGSALGGFLVGMRPGTDYASVNYRWFCNNYADFAYIDRIVVAPAARRQGLAQSFYSDFSARCSGVPVMTCEVNIQPPNDSSLEFHSLQGFHQVGSQHTDGGAKEVALLAKELK